ncbi:MAG: xanthine dehydrogenase family protein subunit M [Candidatus Riflebacteria bacterium]|nr:xanthine dehydrogenase family protein subunit M [Candidatus Riflebacteria bacterium]
MNLEISYVKPKTVIEVGKILFANSNARIIAGGTDLIVKWKNGLFPELSHFVDLSTLGYNKIELGAGKIRIGSMCTMRQISENRCLQEWFPTLCSAASQVGAPQIRETATLGGNSANASPAGDTIPALMSLEARVIISGINGYKSVEIDRFFKGPGKTTLEEGDFIEAFELSERKTMGRFMKLGERRAHAISKVSAAVSTWDDESESKKFGIALGAVAPTVIRAREAEDFLVGKPLPLAPDCVDKAATMAAECVSPIDDIRSTATYRKKMVKVLVSRILSELGL